jgi:hypothetical protein
MSWWWWFTFLSLEFMCVQNLMKTATSTGIDIEAEAWLCQKLGSSWSPGAAQAVDIVVLLHHLLRIDCLDETEENHH